MSERVSALFAVPEDAERAAAALLDHGGDREEISTAPRQLVIERIVLAETVR
jgi:hypothetical protein